MLLALAARGKIGIAYPRFVLAMVCFELRIGIGFGMGRYPRKVKLPDNHAFQDGTHWTFTDEQYFLQVFELRLTNA